MTNEELRERDPVAYWQGRDVVVNGAVGEVRLVRNGKGYVRFDQGSTGWLSLDRLVPVHPEL